jgi:Protein of unknown function, DUF488
MTEADHGVHTPVLEVATKGEGPSEPGVYGAKVYTARYRAFNPGLGVPIDTTVAGTKGRYRKSFETLHWTRVAPYGLFRPGQRSEDRLSPEEFAVKYLARLDKHEAQILEELDTFRRDYDGTDVYLLCYEDLRQPGVFCHRRMLAEWLQPRLQETIPDLEPLPGPAVG